MPELYLQRAWLVYQPDGYADCIMVQRYSGQDMVVRSYVETPLRCPTRGGVQALIQVLFSQHCKISSFQKNHWAVFCQMPLKSAASDRAVRSIHNIPFRSLTSTCHQR